MNGVSLLVALTMVGVDVGWEQGPGGRLLYTIRIEQTLLQPLRDKQAVVSAVDPNDRNLRRFQIVMTPAVGATTTTPRDVAAAAREETMVQYGWQLGDDGGLDFLVQMTPERLETLANGMPVIGEVPEEVTEIRRIYAFAGVNPLPRTGLPAAPSLLPDGRQTDSSFTRPPLEAPRDNQPPLTAPRDGRYSDNSGRGPSSYRDYNRDNGWRNDTGLSSQPGGSPPYAGGRPADDNRSPSYGWDPRATFPVGRDDRANGYGYAQPSTPPQQPPLAPPAVPSYTQRPISEQVADPKPPAISPPVSPAPWSTAQPGQQPAANWNAQAAQVARTSDDFARPWTPLILTTLALFASLGANAYLSWLAWSFFWRYRDAANDLVRSRAMAAGARQAA